MDYEQKYKDVLEKLRDFYRDYDTVSHLIDVKEELANLFPELKESEDDRIVKELLTFFRESIHGGHILTNKEYDSWIAWLEKQGTSYTKRDIDDAYVKGMAFAKDELEKQKPTWSEEDEARLQSCLNILQVQAKGFMGITETINTKWLKSLKQRYTWKPSDEQMKALHDLNLTGNISYAGQGQELINLYNDLKKLKGE